MNKITPVIFLCLFGLTSCDSLVDVNYPVIDPDGLLNQTIPLPENSKKIMEGIYSVELGQEKFGEQVVLKWSGNNLSIFASKNVSYLVMQGGSIDSAIYFLGYWRHAISTDIGVSKLSISSDEGGSQILKEDSLNLKVILKGTYTSQDGSNNIPFELKYLRPFSDFVKQSDFYILAHRGGGRNSEYLQASENSVEMISLAESFGATGIEIDIHISNDGVPFLYHDSDINLRLTQKTVIWGNIENFSWFQLRSFIKLKNGEKIPSLREALEFILDNTTLRFVWLDLKSEKNEIPIVVELQKEILQRAASMNRDLEIVLGLPDEDKLNNLLAFPDFQNIPSLCELDVDMVRKVNSKVWAPRWTLGTQVDLVRQMHNEGRKAFVWTLDEPSFVESFMRDGEFDGALSNYPSLIAYYYYTR
jgi:glycerophosphoryl diester phosphodiesterase